MSLPASYFANSSMCKEKVYILDPACISARTPRLPSCQPRSVHVVSFRTAKHQKDRNAMRSPPCGPAIKAGKDGHHDEGSNKQSAREDLVVLRDPGMDDETARRIHRGPQNDTGTPATAP